MWSCFFCGGTATATVDEMKVEMYGEHQSWRSSGTITEHRWSQTTVSIPRCETCNGAHRELFADVRAAKRRFLSFKYLSGCLCILGVVAWFTAATAATNLSGAEVDLKWTIGVPVIFLVAAAIVSAGPGKQVWDFRPRIRKIDAMIANYPRVAELIAEGWSVGPRHSDGRVVGVSLRRRTR